LSRHQPMHSHSANSLSITDFISSARGRMFSASLLTGITIETSIFSSFIDTAIHFRPGSRVLNSPIEFILLNSTCCLNSMFQYSPFRESESALNKFFGGFLNFGIFPIVRTVLRRLSPFGRNPFCNRNKPGVCHHPVKGAGAKLVNLPVPPQKFEMLYVPEPVCLKLPLSKLDLAHIGAQAYQKPAHPEHSAKAFNGAPGFGKVNENPVHPA